MGEPFLNLGTFSQTSASEGGSRQGGGAFSPGTGSRIGMRSRSSRFMSCSIRCDCAAVIGQANDQPVTAGPSGEMPRKTYDSPQPARPVEKVARNAPVI